MKDLDIEIKKNGFTYKQVFKNEIGYIYSQQKGEIFIGFEAFYRKENTMYNCISFPGDNAFGIWAWSTRTFERALKHLN